MTDSKRAGSRPGIRELTQEEIGTVAGGDFLVVTPPSGFSIDPINPPAVLLSDSFPSEVLQVVVPPNPIREFVT